MQLPGQGHAVRKCQGQVQTPLWKSQGHVPGRTIASKQVNPALVSLHSGARDTSGVSQENSSSLDEKTKQMG